MDRSTRHFLEWSSVNSKGRNDPLAQKYYEYKYGIDFIYVTFNAIGRLKYPLYNGDRYFAEQSTNKKHIKVYCRFDRPGKSRSIDPMYLNIYEKARLEKNQDGNS